MNILVVDDIPFIAEKIRLLLIENLTIDNVHIAYDYNSAIELVDKNKIDLALLDINLEEEKTGYDVAIEIGKKSIPYLFITSYSDEKNVELALGLNPEGYLVKPIDKVNFLINLKLAIKKKQNKLIQLVIGKKKYQFNKDEILYIKSEGNYCMLYTLYDSILIRNKISDWLKIDEDFIQVHRSYAVNLNQVVQFDTKVSLINKVNLPISNSYRAELMNKL